MSTDPHEVIDAIADLGWLYSHGAFAGVAEVIRERRKQVELGFTPQHDDHHVSGWLVQDATRRTWDAGRRVAAGLDGPEGIEEGCRQGGALLAAEIDRLDRMLNGEA